MNSYAYQGSSEIQVIEKSEIINQVSMYENAVNDGINTYSNIKRQVKELRSMILHDLLDTDTFIYMEFEGGGYAIYDRLGKFIYERTQNGKGPYANYDEEQELFYGGPNNYFVKTHSGIKDIKGGEILSKISYEGISANIDDIQIKNFQQNYKMTYSTSDIILTQHLLGEGIDSPGQIYFPLFEMLKWETVNINGIPYHIYPELSFQDNTNDLVYASNEKGSCAFVALGQALQYYTRIRKMYPELTEYPKLVPESAVNLRKMYDFQGRVLNQNGNPVDPIFKDRYKAEYLQQELMNIAFNGVPQSSYGINWNDFIDTGNNYLIKFGWEQYSLKTRNGSFQADTNIKKGNPVFMELSKGSAYTMN